MNTHDINILLSEVKKIEYRLAEAETREADLRNDYANAEAHKTNLRHDYADAILESGRLFSLLLEAKLRVRRSLLQFFLHSSPRAYLHFIGSRNEI